MKILRRLNAVLKMAIQDIRKWHYFATTKDVPLYIIQLNDSASLYEDTKKAITNGNFYSMGIQFLFNGNSVGYLVCNDFKFFKEINIKNEHNI